MRSPRQPRGVARARVARRRGGTPPAALLTEWTLRLRSARHTHRVGAALGATLQGGEVLALLGDLGTGKTTFVRGLAEGLGIAPGRVTSPTFVVIQPHEGRLTLAHADLYRLDGADQLRDLGLEDYCDGRAVVAVEWADRADGALPRDRLEIHLGHLTPGTRQARFVATSHQAARVLAALARAQSAPRPPAPRPARRKR